VTHSSIADQLRAHAAHRAFTAARLRYVRARIAHAAAPRLRPLQIERQALAKASERMQAALDFHEARLSRARARFEAERPTAFWGTSYARPTFLERIATLGFIDRLYRDLRVWTFCREEIAAELRVCRDRLHVLTRQMNAIVCEQEATIERRLGTSAGLREALNSDEHLALAHSRLLYLSKDLVSER
jgi:hypothetical protein